MIFATENGAQQIPDSLDTGFVEDEYPDGNQFEGKD